MPHPKGRPHLAVNVLFISCPREVNLIDNTLNVAMMCTAAVLPEPYCTDLFANLVRVYYHFLVFAEVVT